MGFARHAATMSTCPPRSKDAPNGVGAVIARDGRVLATGFNGSASGAPHCSDPKHGHMMRGAEATLALMYELKQPVDAYAEELVRKRMDHCVRTIHAEANAIANAARYGIAVGDATLYSTSSPCLACFQLAINAGIGRVVYEKVYWDDDPSRDLARELCIPYEQLSKNSCPNKY